MRQRESGGEVRPAIMKTLLRFALCDIERVEIRSIYLRQRFYKIGYVGLVAGQSGADGVRVYGNVQDPTQLRNAECGLKKRVLLKTAIRNPHSEIGLLLA
jgi:hypothetical protein